MNPFLVYPQDLSKLEKPHTRLYARLDDVIELADPNVSVWRFGCVKADWFDNHRNRVVGVRGPVRRSGLEEMPVFFLEMNMTGEGAAPVFTSSGKPVGVDDWLQIETSAGSGALIFRNLYADGEAVAIDSIEKVEGHTEEDLDEAHDLDEWVRGDAEVEALFAAASRGGIQSFGVYDVGQGTCVSLSPQGNKPAIYFDFGGGTASHTSTRPHMAPDLCLCDNPLFVLSHWDSDHWSAAPLVPASLALDWIAPFQSLTPPQIVFAGTITGKLIVSKAAAGASFSSANATVHRAAGPPSDRNNSGFFLVVEAPAFGGDFFFFPGDADYVNTPAMPATVLGMVATHHGGAWKSGATPPNAAVGAVRRVVFSYGIYKSGKSNSYGHPKAASKAAHGAVGFSALDTPLRSGGSSGNGTGHVYMDWLSSPIPSAPCGRSSCYQNFDQS